MVSHKIFLLKLDRYVIRGPCKNLFASFHIERATFVFSFGIKSSNLPITFGVFQGSILGSLLFLLYTTLNDLNTAISCTPRLFADDACLFFLQINCLLSTLI